MGNKENVLKDLLSTDLDSIVEAGKQKEKTKKKRSIGIVVLASMCLVVTGTLIYTRFLPANQGSKNEQPTAETENFEGQAALDLEKDSPDSTEGETILPEMSDKVQQEEPTEELPQVEKTEKEPGAVAEKKAIQQETAEDFPVHETTQVVVPEKVFPTTISISPNEITTRVLYTPQLAVTLSPENTTETDLTWTSSNMDVATVYASGLVLAGSVGETTITVTTVNGLTATCKVVVEESVFPDSIAMKETSFTMKVGEAHAMEVIYAPESTTERGGTWESSNTAVATVDGKGVVRAVGEGISVITHRMTWKSLSTSCEVTVTP